MQAVAEKHNVIPIFSECSYTTDSRFGTHTTHIETAEALCGKAVLHTIAQVEPIGPKRMLDALIIAPCTGNTLAKIAHGITDTAICMVTKAHLRNDRTVLIALATNDALSGNLGNISTLLSRKNVYFVPMIQDDPENKPHSLVADFDDLIPSFEYAMIGKRVSKIIK